MGNEKRDAVPELKIGFWERLRRQWRESIDFVTLQNEIVALLPHGVNATELFLRLG